jgi:hypothetical protein
LFKWMALSFSASETDMGFVGKEGLYGPLLPIAPVQYPLHRTGY